MYPNPAMTQTGYSSTPKAEYSFYRKGIKIYFPNLNLKVPMKTNLSYMGK